MEEENDKPVYLNIETLEKSLNSGEIVVPKGLTPEQRRLYVKQKLEEIRNEQI